MASEVSIVNMALGKLGETAIVALSDEVKAARIAQDNYAECRDFVLDEHTWNFSKKRGQLAASATAPVWGFDNAFPFPNDCIRPFLVNQENEFSGRWRVEGSSIVTDLDAPLEVIYISRVTDPNQMTARFRQLLATYCAWQWCEAISGSDEKKEKLEEEYARKLATARSRDGQEGIQDQFVADRWEEARLGGGTLRDDIELAYDPGTY
jgi:hypothetical protein